MISRRDMLRIGLFASVGLLPFKEAFPQAGMSPHGADATPAPATVPVHSAGPAAIELTKFVTPLSIPPVIHGSANAPIHVHMRAFRHKAHRDLPASMMWGFNGTWPGPTIAARKGEPISVRWSNSLPARHLFAIDHTIHGAGQDVPDVRTVTHLHGAKVMPDSDGYPDAWVTSDGRLGCVRAANPTQYPNDQAGTTLWYHDHAMGITRLNVYAGLAGFYLIHDPEQDSLNLPAGPYDIPLMIQDRSFAADGTLLYPAVIGGTHPVWMQEFFGNTICVNGKATPFLEVEPRKYRFRILNASNARFYHMTMVPSDAEGAVKGKPADAPPFLQIGSDGGLLPQPVMLHYLLMAPAERFDVIVDFSQHRGSNLVIVNNAPAPYARGGEVVPSEVMQFRVTKPLAGTDTSVVPDSLAPFVPLDASVAVQERTLALVETDRASDGYTMIGLLDKKRWDDPISENPKAGSCEIWSFANTTGDVHPIHLHLVQFQVLNRQSFDVKTYLQNGKLVFTSIPMPPESNERPAWKDTIKSYPGYVTRIIARFDLPTTAKVKPGDEFRYVWHCNVLEHEDNEMMRPYKVIG
jgi:spore coat protein A